MDIDHIRQRIEVIDKLQEDVKVAKTMLKEALDNDAAYEQANEEAKVAASKKKQTRDEVYNLPEHKQILQEVKDNNEEIATLKEILSEELIEYRQHSKTETIKDNEGQLRFFKFSVKLARKQDDLNSNEDKS